MEASITQVAATAGVSIATVSRAFTKPDMVSAATRKRVYDAADKLNYSISRSATSMKTGRSFRIALLVSEDISSWFNSLLLSGLNSMLHDADYDISIYSVATPEERHRFFTDLPVRRNADAVIVSSFSVNPDEVARLKSVHIPVLGVNVPSSSGYDATISIDDRDGMHMMTDHLITLGHTVIAFIRYAAEQTIPHSADLREQGFEDACRSAGDAVHPYTVFFDENAQDPADSAFSRILMLPERPTALCCIMDSIALQMFFTLNRYGLRAPQRVSLTGFDDAVYAKESGLTTMRQNPVELGQAIAEKALQLIDGRTPDLPHEIVPAQLVLRSSTAEPPDRPLAARV